MFTPAARAPRSDSRQPRRRPSRRHRLEVLAVALSASALVLSACSSSDDDTSSSASSSPAASKGELSAASIKTIAGYTGGSGAADSSLEPITWGYVNQEGGAIDFSAYTTQVKALVNVLNTKLGGIDGHPLKLDICHVVSSDEEGQTCGQQFASNKKISAILQFPLINGNASFHSIIDKTDIPVFGPSANTIDDARSTQDYFATGPNISNVPVIAQYVTSVLKAKTVAILGADGNALSQLITRDLVTAFKAAGVTTKLATVSPTSSDVTAPLVAAGVTKADAIVAPLPAARLCASVSQALTTLNATKTPVVSTSFCGNNDTKKLLGSVPDWTFVGGYPDPRAKANDARESAELAVADNLWKATGAGANELDLATASLQGFITAVEVVKQAGGPKATTAAVRTSAAAFDGPLFLGEDKVHWGQNPMFPAVASFAQRIYTHEADGSWVDSGNGWVAAPATRP